MTYLYGAAVQGIQNYIFQINDLKNIIGASELVEQICSSELKSLIGEEWEDDNSIISAAGNIKYIFDNEDTLKNVFLKFPKQIMQLAPGITISQAAVQLNKEFSKAVNELENKLQIQRNRPINSITLGFMGMKRYPKTGLPLINKSINKEFVDASTFAKKNVVDINKRRVLCEKSFYGRNSYGKKLKAEQIASNIEDITDKNNWIAVIHADGNGIGQVVQKVGKNKEDYKKFSIALDNATIKAANDAYEAVKNELEENSIIPIRPIVLGGDDLTVIIRGDLALPYVQKFLESFEKYTGEGDLSILLSEHKVFKNGNKLTACAGIAFIKSSYPFYYGYDLAEQLCKEAKNKTKEYTKDGELPHSCIMFHKVQDSFIMEYKNIAKRELYPNKEISFKFGPYYLSKEEKTKEFFTIKDLIECVDSLSNDNKEGIRSGIRQWLKSLYKNKEMAEQKLIRLKNIQENEENKELLEKLTNAREEKDENDKDIKIQIYPAFDVLAYYTIKNQNTK